jgi:hypothetical protein
MSNYITTASLNLRSQPKIETGNVLAVMPLDTVVEEADPNLQSGFRQVKAILSNDTVQGFASQKFLEATTQTLPTVEPPLQIPMVHLSPGNKIIGLTDTVRIYPLNVPQAENFKTNGLNRITDTVQRKQRIDDVIQFLNVENSERYAPNSSSTYCNIYAYDIACCLGTYLPRVWWTSDAIVKLLKGEQVPVQYDITVTEFTANRIADWFEKFGSLFGWQRHYDLTAFQNEVNNGQLGILVAQRVNMNNPGHIVAVVPETMSFNAKRNNGATVIVPLQSQAGRNNKKYTAGNIWWEDKTRFKKFSFWLSKL